MKPILIVLLLAGVAAAEPEPTPAPSPAPQQSTAELTDICAKAMNADPAFAKSIAATVDKQIDQKTLDAHNDAYHHIQKNERHVLIAYIAMWVIAAGFVIFLWRRQRVLVAQIDLLRKDLDHAAGDAAKEGAP